MCCTKHTSFHDIFSSIVCRSLPDHLTTPDTRKTATALQATILVDNLHSSKSNQNAAHRPRQETGGQPISGVDPLVLTLVVANDNQSNATRFSLN